jgi:zinc/manganese transport system substrate-binding protein
VKRRALLLSVPASALALGVRADTPLKVVATFSVLGDMVRQIAGDRGALTVIVGPDGDTEAYEPTAADARALADADLLVMNGLNKEFEPWLDGLIRQSGFHGTRVVASDGVRTLRKAEEESGREAGAAELDQHAWHDAANAAIYAANIAAALARADPSQADAYNAQGAAYRAQLVALDAWARQQIGGVPAAKRKVIASHDGFAYLARAYGITIIGASGWTNDKEPTAAQVAQLIRQIRQDRIKAIFVENMNDPRLIQRIARETGAEVGGELYSDALSKPGEDGDTYVRMFRHNIETLRAGILRN